MTELYSTHHENFVPCFPEVLAFGDKEKESKTVTPNLRQSIIAQIADIKSYLSVATVKQPDTSSSYNANGIHIRLSRVDRTQQQYLLMVGHLSERWMHYSIP